MRFNICPHNIDQPTRQGQARIHSHVLRQSSLLSGLAPELQEKLIAIGRAQIWRRGELVFMDGSPVEGFYYILSGKVKEYYYNGGGEEFLRRVIYPGHYVSLHSLFKEAPLHTYACQSLTTTEGVIWPADAFINLLQSYPQLGVQVARILANHYELSCRRNCLCKKKRANSRVAGYLLSKLNPECCHIGCSNNNVGCCQLDLRPITIAAEDISLARETMTRTLAQLEKQGMIRHCRGLVTILDEQALKIVSGVE